MGVGGDDSWGAEVHKQYKLLGDKERSLKFMTSYHTSGTVFAL